MSASALIDVRKDFPMLEKRMNGKPLVYFDSAATTLKPYQVIEAMSDFYTESYATVHRSVYGLAAEATELYSSVRTKVKQFIHAAHEEEIIFTRGTTDSINLAAHCLGKLLLDEGDEVLISVMEHHSNIVPWQIVCKERGAVLKAIPITEKGMLNLEAFEQLLSDRTKIVSVAHTANATGTLNPIEQIIRRAHEKEAVVVIDGAQSIGHMTIDVQALDADFFAFSGHKMYGPTGIGVLYGKKQWLELMEPYQGGGDMIEFVSIEESSYQQPPLKFEPGTPIIAPVIGLGAAIDYIQSVGLENILQGENALLEKATEMLLEIPELTIVGTAPQKGPIISFDVKNVHPLDLGTLLSLKGIALRTGQMCAQPTLDHFKLSSLSRISFSFYNTFEEVDYFIKMLKETLPLLV